MCNNLYLDIYIYSHFLQHLYHTQIFFFSYQLQVIPATDAKILIDKSINTIIFLFSDNLGYNFEISFYYFFSFFIYVFEIIFCNLIWARVFEELWFVRNLSLIIVIKQISSGIFFVGDDNVVFAEWLADERRLCLIFSRDHCQKSSPSRISNTPRARFEPVQNLNSVFVA